MKAAVFHSFLDNIGGAEVVALMTARALNADIYTTNYCPSKISLMGFQDLLPRIHSIGKIPFQAPFKQQFALWKFRCLKLSERYDLHIIMDDWSVSVAHHHTATLWYIHAPFNELWEYKNFIKREMLSWWQRPAFEAWVWFNRILTKKYISKIEHYLCNSSNSQKRAKKYLNLNASIVYPPINTIHYQYEKSEGFWLSVNRLTRAKRIELQIEAFRQLPDERLIIVGSYEKGARHFEDYVSELKHSLPSNVSIISWIKDDELRALYSNSKGLIATAFDEDFGLTVLESMASGKPVIASNSGGYKETIVHNETGYLIDNLDSQTLAQAISLMSTKLSDSPDQFKDACLKRAKKFDLKEFIIGIQKNF